MIKNTWKYQGIINNKKLELNDNNNIYCQLTTDNPEKQRTRGKQYIPQIMKRDALHGSLGSERWVCGASEATETKSQTDTEHGRPIRQNRTRKPHAPRFESETVLATLPFCWRCRVCSSVLLVLIALPFCWCWLLFRFSGAGCASVLLVLAALPFC